MLMVIGWKPLTWGCMGRTEVLEAGAQFGSCENEEKGALPGIFGILSMGSSYCHQEDVLEIHIPRIL